MKQGITIVELVISIAALATISIFAVTYLFQILASRDKVLGQSEATEVANSVLNRIGTSVKTATLLAVPSSSVLQVQNDAQCEVYSLSGQRLYYDVQSPASPCPAATTTTPISNSTANITNAISPTVTLFALSGDGITLTTEIRIQANRPFSSSTVTLKDSASRRR